MESSVYRWARALVTPASKEETLNFVRFTNEGSPEVTEMQKIPNGDGVPKGAEGLADGACPEEVYDEHDPRCRDNKITEWQAGWNVTNAIQVNTSIMACLKATSPQRYSLDGFSFSLQIT